MTNEEWHDRSGVWREWALMIAVFLFMVLWYAFWTPIVFACVLTARLRK